MVMALIWVISVATMVTGGEIEVVTMVKIGVIEVLMMEDVGLGLNRPATFHLSIWNKLLMAIVEVDIGPRPATLPPITQVTMVDCFIYLLILIMSMILFMTI